MNIFKKIIEKLKIRYICRKYGIEYFGINKDLSIDVHHDVDLNGLELKELPLNFNEVWGHFNCNNNRLTSLKGSPKFVNGHFHCRNNLLTSLKYSPKIVNGYFHCSDNLLTSLEYSPNKIVNVFYCGRNNLKDFKGLNTKGIKNFSYYGNSIYTDFMKYCDRNNIDFKQFNINLPDFIEYIEKFKVIKNGNINKKRMDYLFSLFSPCLLKNKSKYYGKERNQESFV